MNEPLNGMEGMEIMEEMLYEHVIIYLDQKLLS